MTLPLYVALIWHQHQPMYKSALTGQYLMPWVRLHGIKDYLDLIVLLERYPKLHQTVNLVPSLIQQIEETAKGEAIDPWLECLLSETLTEDQKVFVVQRFFDATWEQMIRPHPRYGELLDLRETKGLSWCLDNWTDQDFSDLMAWYNLCWFDPIFQAEDIQIKRWIKKGKNFSYADRVDIYAKQKTILGKIIPKHRQLQESGQLEVTTTPYTHPILPLLTDTDSARVACPHLRLPEHAFHWPEDVDVHLERAQDLYKKRFKVPARGLWPSEQSVSPEIIPAVLRQGFQWMISDEGILGRTLGIHWERDMYGHVQQAEQLYQPYRVIAPEGEITMIFRDHRLSDLIGFRYSTMDPEEAAQDFIEQLEAIQRRLVDQKTTNHPHLVTIALDGENCWEFYEKDGLPFLQAFYQLFSDHPFLKMVTVSEYLEEFPPRQNFSSDRLLSGSWINSDFTIWIGDPIKNKAWSLLATARQKIANHPNPPQAAYEALWAAEGSDWFWWFGKPHSSHHDYLFDQLFREHLQGIYTALGQTAPQALYSPLEPPHVLYKQMPTPNLDGTGTDEAWDHALSLDLGSSRGTMYENVPISRIYYGMNQEHLFIRVDWQEKPQTIDFYFYVPSRTDITSLIPDEDCPLEAPYTYRYRYHIQVFKGLSLMAAGEYDQWFSQNLQVQYGLLQCLEIAIPWSDLHLNAGDTVCWVALARLSDHRLIPLTGEIIELELSGRVG